MYLKQEKLAPLLKYPGGKDSELKFIHKFLPTTINSFYEPFLGGGSVYLSIDVDKYFVNDKSQELMYFYESIKNEDRIFFEKLNAINHNWKLITDITRNHGDELSKLYCQYFHETINEVELSNYIVEFIVQNTEEFNGLLSHDFNCDIENFIGTLKKTLLSKFKRMKKISKERGSLSQEDILDNIESAIKASFYTHLRYLFNNQEKFSTSKGFHTAIYFFIRQMCYSSMFRYNKSGGFNVPYGGISYNRKNFDKSLVYFKEKKLLDHLNKTKFGNQDFYDFMQCNPPEADDFIFLDPPYDSEFSTYSNNSFESSDQERLATYLITECVANFMLVIKNTPLITSLYTEGTKTKNGNRIEIVSFDKKYSVSFKNRNNKNAEHLIITNYRIEGDL